MNAKLVDSLLEALIFPGEEGGTEGQPPSHPRFKWKPPGEVPASQAAPTRLGKPSSLSKPGFADPEDRVGKYSMSDLLPKSEVATSDDLIDFFARIRDAKSGKKKQAWQKEFDAHRTEFESKLHAFVDKLLTEAVCDVCGEEVGDRWFADKARSGQKVAICGRCYLQDISGEHSTDVPHDFPGSTDVDPDFPNDQELDNEGPPLRYPDYDQARLGRTQARRLQSDPPLVRPPGV